MSKFLTKESENPLVLLLKKNLIPRYLTEFLGRIKREQYKRAWGRQRMKSNSFSVSKEKNSSLQNPT